MDWNKVWPALDIWHKTLNAPMFAHIHAAAEEELMAAKEDRKPPPSPSIADLKAAQASAPLPVAQPLEPQPDVVRNVYEGLPGPAEAATVADTKGRV